MLKKNVSKMKKKDENIKERMLWMKDATNRRSITGEQSFVNPF